MAVYTEIYLDQGTTFNKVITVRDANTNALLNVSGSTVTGQIRKSFYSSNASGNLTCTVTDAGNGEITLTMTAANTSNIKDGKYLFDVKAVDANNVTSRILEGIMIITPQVTR